MIDLMRNVLNGYVGMHEEEGRFLKTLNPLLRLWSNGWIETDLDWKSVDLVMGLKYTDFKHLAKTLMSLTFCLTLIHITLFIVT